MLIATVFYPACIWLTIANLCLVYGLSLDLAAPFTARTGILTYAGGYLLEISGVHLEPWQTPLLLTDQIPPELFCRDKWKSI